MEENNPNNNLSMNDDSLNLSYDLNKDKKYSYHGDNSTFFIIYLKNIFLTFITLGLYYPWAKVEILKFHYQNTELEGKRFQFTGTGKEVFKGFIKVYGLIILFYLALGMASTSNSPSVIGIIGLIFYLCLFAIIPLAIHGALRYRSSRSVYSGIHFKYSGDRNEFVKLFFKNLFLTVVTFGLYASWMQVNLREYIYSHAKFGNITFKFNGEGKSLFFLMLKGILLSYVTLGIYSLWFYRDILKYYTDHSKVIQDGKESSLNLDLSVSEVFKLLAINLLILIFTFGLAAPIVVIRTMKVIIGNMTLVGPVDLNAVSQGNVDDYDDASGDDYLDFFDIDFL